MKTRLIMVVPRLPYPVISGGEARVATLLGYLHKSFAVELFCFRSGDHGGIEAAAGLWVERTLGARLTLVERTPGAFDAAPEALPAIARSFYEPGMAKALAASVGSGGPCLIQLEFSQMAQYATALCSRAPVIVTEHDTGLLSLSRSYQRPKMVRPEEERRELLKARRHLRTVYAQCDRVIAVSRSDADRLRRFCPQARVESVPTGVDLDRFAFRGLEGRRPGLVAFMGHYPHYPNEDAALRLCREVLPRLVEDVPGAAVRLIGSAPTPAVRELACARVEIVGTVADVRPWLAQARVFAAPMRLGRGIKGKILEAFALGTPVVATPEAVEAMDGAEPGRHMLVARTPKATASAVARLLKDDGLSSRMAAEARRYVEKRFGWDRQARRLGAVYQEVCRERGVPV